MTLAEPILTQAQALATRCAEDFPFFAATCLKIRDPDGNIIPLRLNRNQRHLHERVEAHFKKHGKVRIVLTKARQGGLSTYVQARFYWQLWRSRRALRAFILTHDDAATSNLFGMAQRFQDLMPPHLKPVPKVGNAKELVFAANDCGYQVATAGGKAIGRSYTIQLLHCSEVPSWPNAEEHLESLLVTALSKGPGSESFIEATAKGVGNVYHRYAMAAARGDSDYELVFEPWFWTERYRERCPQSFAETCPDEFSEYGEMHALDWEQLYWFYKTNREIAQGKGADINRIHPITRQEFPATFEEAFQTSGDSFIPALSVLRARKPEKPIVGRGPVILGIDPARDTDNVGLIDRCGRRMGERICEVWKPDGNTVYLAQRLASLITRLNPDMINIDAGGNGADLYDILSDMGHGDRINVVNFGSSPVGNGPTGDRMYENRRAEMWDTMRDWFETEGGVQIPDDDNLHIDLTSAVWGPRATRYSTNNALIMEKKDYIKERIGHSPDLGDAAALTHAVPLAPTMLSAQTAPAKRHVRRKRGGY